MVAVKGLESWLLADSDCLRKRWPGHNFNVPQDTASVNPKVEWKRLLKAAGEEAAKNKYKKPWLANELRGDFSMARGVARSSTMRHCFE